MTNMTPTQKKAKIVSMESIIIGCDFNQDRFGNFTDNNKDYRFKFSKTSLRYEKKINKAWHKIQSDYLKNIKVLDNEIIINGKSVCKSVVAPVVKPVTVAPVVNPVTVKPVKPVKPEKSIIDILCADIPIVNKTVPKTKAEKKTPKIKFTRDIAVFQAIRELKTFTFIELMNKSDSIMVAKGYSANPTATNVNKYVLTGLLAFNVVTASMPGTISMKNLIKYTLVPND